MFRTLNIVLDLFSVETFFFFDCFLMNSFVDMPHWTSYALPLK